MANIFSGLRKIQADLDVLWRFMKGSPSFGWAVVTAVNPLRIRYDGEATPVAGSPSGDTAGLQVGDRVWCQRINRRDIVLVNRGSGRPYAMAAGSVTVPGGSGAVTSATVTLPVGRFTQTPLITLTASSGVPQRLLGPSHADRSTSSFTVYLVRDNDGDTGVHWQAVQMTPTSATG